MMSMDSLKYQYVVFVSLFVFFCVVIRSHFVRILM